MVRFIELFGQSPMAVLRELRMRHATMLLATNGMSIDQIAVGVGYSNRGSFLRAFPKSFGCGPLDYRAEMLSISGSAALDCGRRDSKSRSRRRSSGSRDLGWRARPNGAMFCTRHRRTGGTDVATPRPRTLGRVRQPRR